MTLQPDPDVRMPDYPDRGCALHPSCLACPRPVCIHDDPRVAGARVLQQLADRRTEEAMDLYRAGVPVAEIAARTGIPQRAIYRALARNGVARSGVARRHPDSLPKGSPDGSSTENGCPWSRRGYLGD